MGPRPKKSASSRRRLRTARALIPRSPVLKRAARLPKFIGGPADAEKKLAGLKVVLVGLGSVGGRMALHLARFGVALLWLVDPKVFKAESLLTHEIGPEHVGKFKAVVMGERCRAISPGTRVKVFACRVEELPMDAFADADLVVMATDNLAAELEVSRRCRQLGKPLFQAAVHGESLVAQVRGFANSSDESPCVGCGYNAEEWRQLTRQIQFSCEGAAAGNTAPQIAELATMSVPNICSLASDLALNQVIRHVLQLGPPVTDTILEYCGHTNRAVTSPLLRRVDCPCDHRRYALSPPPKSLHEVCCAELSAAAGFHNGTGVVNFAVDGREWARLGECKCPAPRAVARFIPNGQADAGRCAKCRAPIRVPLFFRQRAVSAWTLGEALARPLASLAAGQINCVLADDGQRAVLFRAAKT